MLGIGSVLETPPPVQPLLFPLVAADRGATTACWPEASFMLQHEVSMPRGSCTRGSCAAARAQQFLASLSHGMLVGLRTTLKMPPSLQKKFESKSARRRWGQQQRHQRFARCRVVGLWPDRGLVHVKHVSNGTKEELDALGAFNLLVPL